MKIRALAAVALFASVASIALADDDVATVLAGVQKAIGVKAGSFPNLVLKGTDDTGGVTAEDTLHVEGGGRFREERRGALGQTIGYDGKDCWVLEPFGTERLFHFNDRETALMDAWLTTGLWAAHPEWFEIKVSTGAGDGPVHVVVRLKGGVREADLSIDRSTMMPTGYLVETPVGPEVYSFSEYREAGGVKVPGKVFDKTEFEEHTTLYAQVTVDGSHPDFAFHAHAATKVKYDPSKPATIETKRAISGHTLVHPLVDGQDVGWFILDSGAGIMVIDDAAAEKLKWTRFGKTAMAGVGGVVKSGFDQGKTFQLGQVTLLDPVYAQLDLGMISKFLGVTIAGVCGYQFFESATVTLQPQSGTAAVYAPKAFKQEGVKWQALQLEDNCPVVTAKFEGDHEGPFRLDTGDAGTITFHSPAVAKFKLLDGRETKNAAAGGVGGLQVIKVGTLKWVEVGGHRLENVHAAFSDTKKGTFADQYLLGNIGQTLFRGQTIVFDYPQQQIAFVSDVPK